MADPFLSAADGSIQAQWLAFEGLIDLRCEETALPAIESILQIELPQQANRYLRRGELSACWMAPSHWLLRLPEQDESALVAKLTNFAVSADCSDQAAVTVVSDAYIGIGLKGPGAMRVLAAGCPLELGRLGPGYCARTLLARAQVMLIVLNDRAEYELLVDRSHADYVRQWLATAVAATSGAIVAAGTNANGSV